MFEVAFFLLFDGSELVYEGRLITAGPLPAEAMHSVLLDFVPDYEVNRLSFPGRPIGDAYLTTTEGEDSVGIQPQ